MFCCCSRFYSCCCIVIVVLRKNYKDCEYKEPTLIREACLMQTMEI